MDSKVHVKTDGPVPEYLTAGKVYELLPSDWLKGDAGQEVSIYIPACPHLDGRPWTLCDQHGNPVEEHRVAHKAESQMGDLSLAALELARYKALAGKLAEIVSQCQVMGFLQPNPDASPTHRQLVKDAGAALAECEQEVRT